MSIEHIDIGAICSSEPSIPWDTLQYEQLERWGLSSHIFHCNTVTCSHIPSIHSTSQVEHIIQQILRVAHPTATIHTLSVTQLATTQASLRPLQVLQTSDIIRPDGRIIGCIDTDIEGVLVSDQLRELATNPDSDHADLVDDHIGRQELLWQLFQGLVVGGPLCQWEDTWHAYLAATKTAMRAMCDVAPHPSTGEPCITSTAWQVNSIDGEGLHVDGPHCQLIVTLCPASKTAKVWHVDWKAW